MITISLNSENWKKNVIRWSRSEGFFFFHLEAKTEELIQGIDIAMSGNNLIHQVTLKGELHGTLQRVRYFSWIFEVEFDDLKYQKMLHYLE